MTDRFDAHAKALEIETTVKAYVDHAGSRSDSAQDGLLAEKALNDVGQQFFDLWKDPVQLAAVCHELKGLSGETSAQLPNVKIEGGVCQTGDLKFTGLVPDGAGRSHGLVIGPDQYDQGALRITDW